MQEIDAPRNNKAQFHLNDKYTINPTLIKIESKSIKETSFSFKLNTNNVRSKLSDKSSHLTLKSVSTNLKTNISSTNLDSSSKLFFLQRTQSSIFPQSLSIKNKEIPKKVNNKIVDLYNMIISPLKPLIPKLDLVKFIMSPLAKDKMLICDLGIVHTNSFCLPKFSLSINTNELMILYAEKDIKLCRVEYKIFLVYHNKKNYIGKITSNCFRNKFYIFDNNSLHKRTKINLSTNSNTELNHTGLGIINFPNSVFCFTSKTIPNTIQVHLPYLTNKGYFSYNIQEDSNENDRSFETKRSMCSNNPNFEVKTIPPLWSNKYSGYVMKFTNRVRLPSKSNFILAYGKVNILQFGKMSKDIYSLDFKYPLSLFQAFCICVSSIIAKNFYLI